MDEPRSLEVFLGKKRVGALALTPERLCAFQYDSEWVRDGMSISPFDLPLGEELYIARPTLFDGGFGVFDDSLPDGWGRLVLDRYLRKKGEKPEQLSPLQLLALIGKGGRGALEYYPAFALEPGNVDVTDQKMQQMNFSFADFEIAANDVFESKELTGLSIDALFKYSGSSGGARPKAFVWSDGREWLGKFRAPGDGANAGQVEYEYSLLAKRCGISMPETRLFDGKYFGTERFDRTAGGKLHVISAAALLNADYRIPALDYVSLLNACRILTGDMQETEALYRLMVFNVIIQNRDDHAKNFAFLHDGERWRLSPAYDILPSVGFGGYHTTTVNGTGEPGAQDILAVAKAVGIAEKKAHAILDDVVTECVRSNMAKAKWARKFKP